MTFKSLKILTTGTTKGVGKFLAEKLITSRFDRGSKLNELDKNYDVIIHCASNSSKTSYQMIFTSFHMIIFFLPLNY